MKIMIPILGLTLFATASAEASQPRKFRDPHLQIQANIESRFPARMIKSREFVIAKAKEWIACHHGDPSRFAAATDPLSAFLEANPRFTTLEEMEKNHLEEGRVAKQPWSGDYWSYAKGLLGARYDDGEFSLLFDWISRFTFIRKHPAQSLLHEGEAGLAKLSPSEKYDVLIGNRDFQLTSTMWAQGKAYYDQTGDVEGWMGLCHGWAPASLMEPRPIKTIAVDAIDDNRSISLNPSDLKALLTYSWATNDYESVFLGSRCNLKNPPRDENGRITDPSCFDLNPATWHLAVVNSIGLARRSFVMDATYDFEVWNQPVLGYRYTYFNPRSQLSVDRMHDAVVARAEFDSDPFKKYRSPKSKFLIGIEMTIGYVVETQATNRNDDREDLDIIRWVPYRYDLELDANGVIVGGEWHDDAHPDFIWTPKRNAVPQSQVDRMLARIQWTGTGVLPRPWVESAHQQSQLGVIPHTIPRALLQKASR